MIYLLYNPKANNEKNDLTILPANVDPEKYGLKKLNLIGLDLPSFSKELNETDKVMICGGDGTLHHFANNAYGIEFPCPIGLVRSGTGNDFLNDLGQFNNENEIDIRPYLKDLPIVEVGDKKVRCINGAGLGVDGAVCRGVEEYKTKHPNKKANYTLIALKELGLKYKRPNAVIEVDGVRYEYSDVWAMSTMKGKYYGGGKMIAPAQDRNSGKVTVMAMHGGSRLKTLAVFTQVPKGKHVKHTEMIDIIEGYSVHVKFDAPCDMQIDGEVIEGVTEYFVKCEAAAEKSAECYLEAQV